MDRKCVIHQHESRGYISSKNTKGQLCLFKFPIFLNFEGKKSHGLFALSTASPEATSLPATHVPVCCVRYTRMNKRLVLFPRKPKVKKTFGGKSLFGKMDHFLQTPKATYPEVYRSH